MSLVEHARRELELRGDPQEDIDWYLEVIGKFASYGHSGGSASVAIPTLNALLQFRNLTSLTDNPKQWNKVGSNMWQSTRCSEAFSSDKGKTYYLLSEGACDTHQEPIHVSVPT